MKSAVKWGLLGLFTIIGIFLLSNINQALINYDPNLMRLKISGEISMQLVSFRLPGSAVVSEEEDGGVLSVPDGKLGEYMELAMENPKVLRINTVMLERPRISLPNYGHAVKYLLKQYMKGDFGKIRTGSGHGEIPMAEAVKDMLSRTSHYFFPAMLLAVSSGIVLSLLASLWKKTGRLLDAVHGLFMGLPDFLLIMVIQFAAIYAHKMTGNRTILVVQFGNQVPFLIPFLTIALVPGALIYGTLRLAIQRELTQNYVLTARSKGLSRARVLLFHVFRNVMNDLLSILPKATTLALASMAVAEAVCDILGLGGIIVSPRMQGVSALPVSCMILALFSMLFHGLYALLHNRFIVHTREAA